MLWLQFQSTFLLLLAKRNQPRIFNLRTWLISKIIFIKQTSQLFGVNRLGEYLLHSCLHSHIHIILIVIGRTHDNDTILVLFDFIVLYNLIIMWIYFFSSLDSIYNWHVYIHKYQLISTFTTLVFILNHFYSHFPIIGIIYSDVEIFKHSFQCYMIEWNIIT